MKGTLQMSDMPVETTATEPEKASNPVPATTAPPVDIEAIKKAAAAEARREAQSAKDREVARLHRQHQQEMADLRASVAPKLQKAGYEPEPIFNDMDTLRDARSYRELAAQADQEATWRKHVEDTAETYGVDPHGKWTDVSDVDPRHAAQEIINRAKAEMKIKAAKEVEDERKAARAAANAKAEAKVENGDFDTLGGAPSAGTPSLDDQYKKEMLAARGKGLPAGRAIKEKYRAKGVDVDHIRVA